MIQFTQPALHATILALSVSLLDWELVADRDMPAPPGPPEPPGSEELSGREEPLFPPSSRPHCLPRRAPLTCTPKMPKMMKKAQQMRTMLPMGLREEMSVSTTSFRPGARLMTLQAGRDRGHC